MPYVLKPSARRLLAFAAAFLLLGLNGASPPPATDQVVLAWHAPAKDSQFNGDSTVEMHATFQMPGWLKAAAAAAGHSADPIFVVEDRTRTYTTPQGGDKVFVNDAYARHHGGPNNTDPTVKRRLRMQIVPFDAAGKYSIEPFLCKDEPPLDDRTPSTFTQCAGSDPPTSYRYQDPGDAALAQLPSGPITIGDSWTFSRPVAVGREQGSGTMDFVDTLQRIDERGKRKVAVIDVTASGRIIPPSDEQARGFHTATLTLSGTAEFDVNQGTPGIQHYTSHVEWHTNLMGVGVGEIFEEVYDAKPWTNSAKQ